MLCAKNTMLEATGFTKSDFLHCSGTRILNSKGEEIFLRGKNLGGWLLQETWMASFTGADSQWELVNKLTSRFGKDEANRLISLFEDNFITAYDIENIKNLGFNCVRIPFWYGNFYSDDCGTVDSKDGKLDFSRLDGIIEECSKRKIYVILDMHGVPGHQSIAHHSCRTNHCELYKSTDFGVNFRRLGAELWSEIADHYKNNPAVAAYDLMNEPMCDYKGRQKQNEKYHKVYSLFYNAVRKKDTKHIITLEAIWTPLDIPHPKKAGWTNVMYQYHLYLFANWQYAAMPYLNQIRHFNVPVLIGEFSPCRGKANWESIIKTFNKNGYNWLTWTYKGHSQWGETSDWFMFGTNGDEIVLDINTCSKSDIEEKWGKAMRTQNGWQPMNNSALIGSLAKQ